MAEHTHEPYTELHQAPETLRRVDNVPLSIEQLNALLADAYEHGQTIDPVEPEDEPGFRPDIGAAKRHFRETHTVEGGLWVAKEK
jgi:hypothetical protein